MRSPAKCDGFYTFFLLSVKNSGVFFFLRERHYGKGQLSRLVAGTKCASPSHHASPRRHSGSIQYSRSCHLETPTLQEEFPFTETVRRQGLTRVLLWDSHADALPVFAGFEPVTFTSQRLQADLGEVAHPYFFVMANTTHAESINLNSTLNQSHSSATHGIHGGEDSMSMGRRLE